MKRSSIRSILVLGAVAFLGYLFGAYSLANDVWPVDALRKFKQQFRKPTPHSLLRPQFDTYGRLVSYPGKRDVACPAQTSRTVVLLLLGQSNAGNHAGQRFESAFDRKVLNFFDGKCFVASSPLLGASGHAGESWTLLGNRLVETGAAEQVILVPAAIGATEIARWQAGGDLNPMLASVLDDVRSRYKVTHVLWHQGEKDFGLDTSTEQYVESFRSLVDSIRRKDVDAPIYASIASKCGVVPRWTPNNTVAVAQRSLIDADRNIRSGVDSDALLDRLDRYDDCHLAGSGQLKFVDGWLPILSNAIRTEIEQPP